MHYLHPPQAENYLFEGWQSFWAWPLSVRIGSSLSSPRHSRKTRALLELSLLQAEHPQLSVSRTEVLQPWGIFVASSGFAPIGPCLSHTVHPQSWMRCMCEGLLTISCSKLLPGTFFFFPSIVFVYLCGPQPSKDSHVQESTVPWHPCSARRAFPSPSGSA